MWRSGRLNRQRHVRRTLPRQIRNRVERKLGHSRDELLVRLEIQHADPPRLGRLADQRVAQLPPFAIHGHGVELRDGVLELLIDAADFAKLDGLEREHGEAGQFELDGHLEDQGVEVVGVELAVRVGPVDVARVDVAQQSLDDLWVFVFDGDGDWLLHGRMSAILTESK